MSENRYQRQYIHDFVAGAACNAKVAMAMIEAVRTLEVVNEAGVVVEGEEHALDFSSQIVNLKAALHLMGLEGDEDH